jgi:hypothetical protein
MKFYETHKIVGLLVLLVLLWEPNFSIGNYESNTLAFFRAIEEKNATVIKNPTAYNRLSIKISNVEFKYYYVERNPSHVVPRAAIEVIKVIKSTPDVDGIQGTHTNSKSNVSQRFVEKFFYSINFTIMPVEAKRFIAFVNKNKEGRFQVRVGDQSLGVAQFYWPVEINKSGKLEFTIIPREDNLTEIKKILAPIENKVVWE